jgi:hypothetical protein
MTTQVICIPNSEGTFDSQLQCENDINDASVLLSQPVEQAVDIANYAYIWFNNSDPLKTITEEEKDFIHETITKGTFPTYLQDYTDADKAAILANEIEFVRKKFNKAGLFHITILQIPRILYDLFNLLFYYYENPKTSKEPLKTDLQIDYSGEGKKKDYVKTIEMYKDFTIQNIEKFKDKIFELNNKIIDFLNKYTFLNISKPYTIDRNYNAILESIMINIKKIRPENRQHYSTRIDTNLREDIYRQTLDLESKPSINSILLYRGADFTMDSTIENKDGKQYPYSLSINLSILSGFLGDRTACTINFMTDYDGEKLNGDKIKYTIKKFMFGDGSEEDSLFFIPPIPPYLQLYCNGEFWHPRTKIGNDVLAGKQIIKGFIGEMNFDEGYTYLKSDKPMKELEKIYQSYIKVKNIATWRKYIKYKTKYLELKNQLGM